MGDPSTEALASARFEKQDLGRMLDVGQIDDGDTGRWDMAGEDGGHVLALQVWDI